MISIRMGFHNKPVFLLNFVGLCGLRNVFKSSCEQSWSFVRVTLGLAIDGMEISQWIHVSE